MNAFLCDRNARASQGFLLPFCARCVRQASGIGESRVHVAIVVDILPRIKEKDKISCVLRIQWTTDSSQ